MSRKLYQGDESCQSTGENQVLQFLLQDYSDSTTKEVNSVRYVFYVMFHAKI